MRFYTNPHQFSCGIDLHARSMYVCVLGHDGEIVLHRHMKAAPEPFLKAVAPYRLTPRYMPITSSTNSLGSLSTGVKPALIPMHAFPSISGIQPWR
jgi:hypothetical protein